MSSSQSNVRELSTINRQIPEVKNLMSAVTKLGWDLRVPLIAQSLGLGYSIDTKMLDKDLPLPRGSVGRKMGFGTLGEIISKPASEGGLGIDWNDWLCDIKAYQYKKKFGLYYASQSEVVKEFEAVRDALGHNPVTLHEFTKARDEILIRNHQKRERQLQEQKAELQEQLDRVTGERDDITTTYSRTQERLEALRREYSDLEADYKAEMDRLKSANDANISEAEERAREEVSEKYQARIQKLRLGMSSLETELSDALRHSSQLEKSSAKMEQAISELRDSLDRKESELRNARSTIHQQEEAIARNEQMINELEIRIEEISSETGLAQLEHSLNKHRERLIRLSEHFKTMKGSRDQYRERLEKSRQRVSKLKAEIRDKRAELKTQGGKLKAAELDASRKAKSIASHRSVRNVLIVTTVGSLSLLVGLASLIG